MTDSKRALLREALDAAGRIASEWTRSRALLRLLPHLPADMLDDALAFARAMRDPGTRGKTLAAIAPYLDTTERDTARREALEAARQAPDVTSKASALSRLARQAVHEADRRNLGREALAAICDMTDATGQILELAALPDELLPEALAFVRGLPEAWSRIEGLCALANRLAGDARSAVVSEALALAHSLDEPDLHATALCSVGALLEEDQKPSVAREALSAAQSSQDDAIRSAVCEVFATDFPAPLVDEALALARQIGDVAHRACAVAALAPRLRDEDRQAAIRDAFARIDSTGDAWARSDALSDLARALPVDLQAQALAQARALEDAWARANALGALSEAFTGELRAQAWEEALASAHHAPEGWARVRALLSVARRLPDVTDETSLR